MHEKRIAYYRKLKGLTQQELANAVGLSRSMISLLELGRTTTNDETMQKIADALHIEVDDLEEPEDIRKNLVETLAQLTLAGKILWTKADKAKQAEFGAKASDEEIAYSSDAVLGTEYLLLFEKSEKPKCARLLYFDYELGQTVKIGDYKDYPSQFARLIGLVSNTHIYYEYGKIAQLLIEAKKALDEE